VLRISLVTSGPPDLLTGGHLYHRRMQQRAGAHGVVMERVSVRRLRNPFRRAGRVVLVDSLVAWAVLPWVLVGAHHGRPLAAIVHQPPGGVDHGRVRRVLQGPLDRALYRRCSLLIATSEAFARELVDCWHLPRARLCVVEPGRDLPIAAEAPAVEDLRRGRRIAVLNVANWWPNKGVLELLEAVAALAPDRVTLHLVGRDDVDVSYGGRVHERLRAADLATRAVIHGSLAPPQVGRLYAGADAFASASHSETYGMVFGEAVAAGLPIVGWRTGNLPHLVEDGREGCLVPNGDVGGLTRALERLATDEAWREELAAAARRRGLTLPTWDEAADRFFSALGRLVGTPG
jgi:glycosyltransferase involved in cell wall biosynthesis